MFQDSKRPKGQHKEKFVEISESLFRGESPFLKDPQTFLDTYFLLPINTACLTHLIQSTSAENLVNRRDNIQYLFQGCIDRLKVNDTKSDQRRLSQCALFLAILFRNLFLKKRLSNENVIYILTNLDKAEDVFNDLLQTLAQLISSPATRSVALTLALAISSGNDNVNQNQLNGYFMHSKDLLKALMQAIADETNVDDQRAAVFLFCILANYELRSPYLQYISSCKDTAPLEKICTLFTNILVEMTSEYMQLKDDDENLTKAVVSYLARWFPGTSSSNSPASGHDTITTETLADFPPTAASLLLFLYVLIKTNTHFVTLFLREACEESPRLFTSLLSFASYLFQHNRNERSSAYSKLVCLMLLRLVEDNAVLEFASKNEFVVRLCRQRTPALPHVKKSRLLLCIMLDNSLLYIKHNMRKKLDIATYNITFLTIHRILSFLNKRHLRLDYYWTEFWPILTGFLHFVVGHMNDLENNYNFRDLIASFMSVLNVCITHGGDFLPDEKSYDMLYYEVIRAADDFADLANFVSNSTGRQRGDEFLLVLGHREFANIQLICDKLKPALDEKSQRAHFSKPEQVMAVIKENYSSLELLPMKIEATVYNDFPAESGFFVQLLRIIVTDFMGSIVKL